MTQGNPNSWTDQISEAIATAVKLTSDTMKTATNTVQGTTAAIEDTILPTVQRIVEQSTETVGRMVTPIAENPMVQFGTKVPGLKWFLAALGQVDVDKVQQDVEELRQKYPLETPEQLSHRVIVDAAVKAGGVGLATNFIPPLAITLLAIDLAAVTALQAEMMYRIASIHGFPLTDSTRRGELLAIWGLSIGGSGMLKTGLSIVEVIPLIGTVVGTTSNAALLYSLGHIAYRFYDAKQKNLVAKEITDSVQDGDTSVV